MADALHGLAVVAAMALVGGLIGYVTNVIAVKMLFRPRKPVCLLHGRVCIQGVIPARKDAIASRLADVASSHILSEEARKRFSGLFKERLREAITGVVLDNLLRHAPRTPFTGKLASVIADAIVDAVTPRIFRLYEEAMSRIDLREVVEGELRRLSTEDVEEIFYKLAGRELRFIELAGLALGSIIGLVEGVLILALA
ncbi:MAG: DUF445 family protein [Desulfurococcales archaeon]|nr:DUF445 family protein [Desulfurococcales archaeon]